MRTQFSRRSFRQKYRSVQALGITTVVVVVIIAADLLSHGALRARTRAIASDAYAVYVHIVESGLFSTRAALATENQKLKDQITQLQESTASIAVLQEENAQLRDLVHLSQISPGVTAPISSSFRSSPYGTFIIGAGTQSGIKVNDLVESSGGFVIGRVSDVGDTNAIITEIFSPRASVNVLIDGADVPAQGLGSGRASIQVPRGIIVNVGDVVTVPEFSQRPVGVVGNVTANPTDAYSQVYVSLPINLSSLSFVYVVTQ